MSGWTLAQLLCAHNFIRIFLSLFLNEVLHNKTSTQTYNHESITNIRLYLSIWPFDSPLDFTSAIQWPVTGHSFDEAKTSFDEGKTSETLPLLIAASPSPQAKFIAIYVAREVTGAVEVNEETTFETFFKC